MELNELSQEQEKKLIELIKEGSIFIYPTDTIYGLGCNALDEGAVKKVREIKSRDKDKPLSVIAPSKEWILNNLETTLGFIDKYLPGPYTLILKKKNPDFLKHVSASETLGVRIPDHEFTKIIQKAEVPFITTSINLAGEKFALSPEEIKSEILEEVDIIVNDGPLEGTPSTIILQDGKELKR